MAENGRLPSTTGRTIINRSHLMVHSVYRRADGPFMRRRWSTRRCSFAVTARFPNWGLPLAKWSTETLKI